ncbi:MAG: DUF2334 domain-containing protein [Clostridia bacterium]|nr:DUF2334 domain-containing protein [Clostridia bacterium]
MDSEKWDRVESILDNYNIQPIVGIIPKCEDRAADFQHSPDPLFWKKALNWKKKGWSLCLHGLHHSFHDTPKGTKYFQKNIGNYTEFAGESIDKQADMINEGIAVFHSNGIVVEGFFAPAHTYDLNTVLACEREKEIRYISDGYALHKFKKHGMTFIPNIFDTPHKMPFGLYTFVYHPSKMKEEDFVFFESFLKNNYGSAVTVQQILDSDCRVRSRGITGLLIEIVLHMKRRIHPYEEFTKK